MTEVIYSKVSVMLPLWIASLFLELHFCLNYFISDVIPRGGSNLKLLLQMLMMNFGDDCCRYQTKVLNRSIRARSHTQACPERVSKLGCLIDLRSLNLLYHSNLAITLLPLHSSHMSDIRWKFVHETQGICFFNKYLAASSNRWMLQVLCTSVFSLDFPWK